MKVTNFHCTNWLLLLQKRNSFEKTLSLLLISSLTSLLASDLIQVKSSVNTEICIQRIITKIENIKGFGVCSVIDHQKNAQRTGLDLPPQKVIIFGNPKAGTKLLQVDAQIGYDLPLGIMVRQGSDETVVEYRNPETFSKIYELSKSPMPKKMGHLLKNLASSCQ